MAYLGPRRIGSRAALAATLVVALVVGLCSLELLVRIAKLAPRRQVVRGFGLHAVDGVPLWEVSNDRQNRACPERHPERTNIIFLGSSITFGTDLDAAKVFTRELEARLNAARPRFCVLNFAQPAFGFEQKYAVARMEIPRYRPAMILWENWAEWREYTLIGEAAYNLQDLQLRPDGSVGMAYIPGPLNRTLFLHSRLYEYVALALGERRAPPPGSSGRVRTDYEEVSAFANEKLSQLVLLTSSAGVKLVLYPTPPLERPFAATAASPPRWHTAIVEFAAAHGIPAYPLQRELIGEDFHELRMDPCCHYSAKGHAALAAVMQRIVLEQLGEQETVLRPAR